jgi:hypothetical protein
MLDLMIDRHWAKNHSIIFPDGEEDLTEWSKEIDDIYEGRTSKHLK